jgi:Ca2+-binding EF-hand superfamily protein
MELFICLPCNLYVVQSIFLIGDRLSEEEFDQLISGMEDNQGMINYHSK